MLIVVYIVTKQILIVWHVSIVAETIDWQGGAFVPTPTTKFSARLIGKPQNWVKNNELGKLVITQK